MFHSFFVQDSHNFLHFLWFQGKDFKKEIAEYRMKTHVFGNSSSPAVAIYGLCRAANHAESEHGANAKLFVEGNLHVDNGLTSLPSATKAINLLKITQMLADSNLRLHKIASKCAKVLEAFPTEDHVLDLRDLDFDKLLLSHDPFMSPSINAGWGWARISRKMF